LVDLDSCVNCNAGLIAASTICPQCGWPKDKPIESVKEEENDIESEPSTETPQVEFVNRVHRPAGVRTLGMAYVIFGILGVSVSIILGSLLMYVIMGNAMSGLGAIGGSGMSMPIPLPIGGVDPAIMASLNMISKIPGLEVFGTVIMGLANASRMMDVGSMMLMLGIVAGVTIVGIIIGLVYFMFGRYLLRGNKWARYLVIAAAIISIPAYISFESGVSVILFVDAAISGLIIYYLLKPHVRAYFNQTSIKKPKTKESKIKTLQTSESMSEVESTTESMSEVESTKLISKTRPMGVTILVVLVALSGTIVVLFGLLFSTYAAIIGIETGGFLGVISGVLVALGIVTLVMAWGLEKAKSWAWSITRILVAISIVVDLIAQNVAGLIVHGIVLYYLYTPIVKDYFGKSAQRL